MAVQVRASHNEKLNKIKGTEKLRIRKRYGVFQCLFLRGFASQGTLKELFREKAP